MKRTIAINKEKLFWVKGMNEEKGMFAMFPIADGVCGKPIYTKTLSGFHKVREVGEDENPAEVIAEVSKAFVCYRSGDKVHTIYKHDVIEASIKFGYAEEGNKKKFCGHIVIGKDNFYFVWDTKHNSLPIVYLKGKPQYGKGYLAKFLLQEYKRLKPTDEAIKEPSKPEEKPTINFTPVDDDVVFNTED